jgi:hypothetical protein
LPIVRSALFLPVTSQFRNVGLALPSTQIPSSPEALIRQFSMSASTASPPST